MFIIMYFLLFQKSMGQHGSSGLGWAHVSASTDLAFNLGTLPPLFPTPAGKPRLVHKAVMEF